MSLWLVRHARPLVDAGVCYGQLDMPADADHTLACARQLAAALPARLHIVCSPLQRCEQLMVALLALRPDLAGKTDDRLQEMNFGRWEGLAWADIAPGELRAWTDDFANYRTGDGENTSRFMARVASAFDDLPGDIDTLWITHAGVIRAASLIAVGVRQLEHAAQWPAAAPAYGQWCKLDLQTDVQDGPQEMT